MAQASVSGISGRRASLFYGSLILGGFLLVLTTDGTAQTAKDKGTAKDKAAAKDKSEKDKPVVAPKEPKPLGLKLHAKSEADVAEMTKIINEKLAAMWKENNIIHSDWVNDHEFIRRASLDIIGRVATPDEIRAYMKYPQETRRSLIIDELLKSDEYPRHWANLWTNWLLSRSGIFGRGRYHEELQKWLQKQFALNRRYDEIVKELITASGKNDDNPAVNFILAHVGEQNPPDRRGADGHFEMVPITSRITRLFLGTQVQCAQCHDHPFTASIKQEMFWGVNAFLRQVERVGNLPMRRQDGLMTLELKDVESANPTASVYYEKRNGVVLKRKATFLPSGDDKEGPPLTPSGEKVIQGIERRKALARYLMDHEKFPLAITNRMWGVFFGRGFTNPIDDFNDNNQPSNPELLNEVAARFKHYGYDQKKLIRWICNSDAYSLSCVANSTNDKQEQEALFSRMIMKSMSPEQLFESLMTATQAEVADKGNEADRAKLRDEWLGKLVSQFGDDEGNEVNFNGTVVQALLMMNGDDINKAISRKDKGMVAMAMRRGTAGGIITELFLASLNRPPTTKEVGMILEKMKTYKWRDKDPHAPYQDLFWALLNSNEFMLNH
jgi:hypothetical protein